MITKFIRLTVYATSVLAISGCVTAWKRLDVAPTGGLSTTSNPVIVRGSRSGMNGLDCFVGEPVRAREYITDAGSLSILVLCFRSGGEFGERTSYFSAVVSFVGQAGHTYELVGYSTCVGCGKRSKLGYDYVEIVDLTDDDQIIGDFRLSGCPNKYRCTQEVPLRVPANTV